MKKKLCALLCAMLLVNLLCIPVTAEFPQPSITVICGENGKVSFEEPIDENTVFTITPDEGYAISSIDLIMGDWDPMDCLRGVTYNGDGTFSFEIPFSVFFDSTLEINFEEEDISKLLNKKSYAILEDESFDELDDADENGIKNGLIREFGYHGFAIAPENIAITSVIDKTNIDLNNGYTTFTYTVSDSDEQIGYILRDFNYVILRSVGTKSGNPVNEIRVTNDDKVIGLPAMDDGVIQFIGVYDFRMEGPLSTDVVDSFSSEEGDSYNLVIEKAFYRAQLHLGNIYPPRPDSLDPVLNLFGFDIIQDDALCVKVSADDSGGEEQRSLEWDLNRYANLTLGEYVSKVYFANDKFVLELPPEGIGNITSIKILNAEEEDIEDQTTANFQGYNISRVGDKYIVEFLSDFYDYITLNLVINDSIERNLNIHRVGVHIAEYYENPPQVFHGTQFGTLIDYDELINGEVHPYRVYATYHIPDNSDMAPYGLYVTYTWANGTTTTRIITEPCDNPVFDDLTEEQYKNGVFIYPEHANPVDYLIYSAVDDTKVPVKINVTVLAGDPTAGSFGGISLGAGAGVEWQP